MSDPRVALLLTLADDELILGHRLSEWTGWVPYLEADLAFSSIAQDEMGHARALYEIAVGLGAAADTDALALGRAPHEYRHASICSQPNGDFAASLARQWLYDRADRIRLDALRAGSWRELNELLAVVELEETFHRAHGDARFERLVGGPVAARQRFLDAIADRLGLLPAFFAPVEGEDELLASGVMTASSTEMLHRFLDEVAPILDEAGIADLADARAEMVPTAAGAVEARPEGDTASPGRGDTDPLTRLATPATRRAEDDEHFLALWEEMTALYRADPKARW